MDKNWKRKLYKEEQLEFLKQIYLERDVEGVETNYQDIIRIHNEKYPDNPIPSVKALLSLLYKRLNLKRTTHSKWFAKEDIRRINSAPIGSETMHDGYVYVKIHNYKRHRHVKGIHDDSTNFMRNYEIKNKYMYKKYHPEEELKKDDKVIFLNGDETDYSIENLYKISRQILGYLTATYGKNFQCGEKELTLAKIAYAELKFQLMQLEQSDERLIFVEKLKKLRNEHNLTKYELARQANISDVTIERIERGDKFPSIKIISKLADFYKVPIEYFLN